MTFKLTDILCTQCGLCCDGSLFDDVELSGEAEATKLEVLGLDIDSDEQHLLLQPCTALQGKRCEIYKHRPECCRTFECRLLQEVKKGIISSDQAKSVISQTLKHVMHMKTLCIKLGETENDLPLKERCIEVLSLPSNSDDDDTNQLRGELAKSMDTMATLINEHFLG